MAKTDRLISGRAKECKECNSTLTSTVFRMTCGQAATIAAALSYVSSRVLTDRPLEGPRALRFVTPPPPPPALLSISCLTRVCWVAEMRSTLLPLAAISYLAMRRSIFTSRKLSGFGGNVIRHAAFSFSSLLLLLLLLLLD